MQVALKELENDENVEYVQPDYKLYSLSYPQDPDFSKQWGLLNNSQAINGVSGTSGVDINVSGAWDTVNGNGDVLVGILDTGIDINHKELTNSIYKNSSEIANNNYDDDKNGYIDDVNGWDFINCDNSVYDNSYDDFHGTHIAGIIAAGADNVGIRGVASGVSIVPLKFMDGGCGFTSDAIEAIEYAKKLGIKVLNCSWGDTHYNYALEQEMKNSDILFVCSAGNDKLDLSINPTYPAAFKLPNVISVGAVDNKGNMASFSNYGAPVDVAAPGVDIYSSMPENNYGYLEGTSMASPFVTGVAALILSCNPNIAPADIKQIIRNTVKGRPNLSGVISTGGIIDAQSAISYTKSHSYTYSPIATPTATPTSATPTPTSTSVISDLPLNLTGVWSSRKSMSKARKDFSAVTLNNKIYAVGYNQTIECYDLSSDSWSDVYTIPAEVAISRKPSISVALNNKIYIIGPNDTNKLFEFDPNGNKWSEKASMSVNRGYGAAVAYNGKIYVVGGIDSESSQSVEVYNPDSDSWSVLPSMNTKRSYHSLVVCGSKMYALGGINSPKSFEVFDFNLNKWSDVQNAPVEISSVSAVSINNSIYVIGTSGNNPNNFYEFNTSNGLWYNKEKMPTDRDALSSVVLDGKIYALGGNDLDKCTTVEEYDFTITPTPSSSVLPTPTSYPSTSTPTIVPTNTPVQGKTISGKVFLSQSTMNLDTSIDVFAETDMGLKYTTNISISAGSSQNNYSIVIPDSSLDKTYRVGYYIKSGRTDLPCTAYYSPYGSAPDPEFAGEVKMNGSNVSGIDMNLLSKKQISGTVYLPDGKTAPQGGIKVVLALSFPDGVYKDSSKQHGYIYDKTIVIPENQNSAPYCFTILENNSNCKYILEYATIAEGYWEDAFYNGPSAVTDKKNAQLLDVRSNNLENVNVTLMKSNYISGMLSLPNGAVAPAGGIQVLVTASSKSKNGLYFKNYFTIPENSNSVKYFINVDTEESSDFTVDYFTQENGYVDLGYYSYSRTSPYYSDALTIYVSNGSASNINMQLIKGKKVSGKIYMPDNRTAVNDVAIEIHANVFKDSSIQYNHSDPDKYGAPDALYLTTVDIPIGANYGEYSLVVPTDGTFYIDFYTDNIDNCIDHGYCINNGSSSQFFADTYIFTPSAQDNYMDINMVKASNVSLTVSLPSGCSTSSDIPLTLYFISLDYLDSNDYPYKVIKYNAIFGKNAVTRNFQLRLPLGNFILMYAVDSTGYVGTAYYSSTGTKTEFDEDTFDDSVIDVNGMQTYLYLTLLYSGTIPTPTPSNSGDTQQQGQNIIRVTSTSTPTPTPTSTGPVTTTVPSSGTVVAQKPTPIPGASDYKDINGHWAKDNILSLLSKGIISGYPDKTIRPDKEISRAEIAKIIVAMLDLKPTTNPDLKFKDAASIQPWAKGYVDVLVKMGVINGYSDNTFKASKNVSRKEMAVMIIKALGYANSKASTSITFKDIDKIPSWALDSVKKGAELGLIKGYEDKTFKPDRNITRAEAFKIISNALLLPKG
ncbi:MAG: S8 family serine peptidase [Bacillota bacterium]|nr:S8 family serine peptidase [Bacillota bacterium]